MSPENNVFDLEAYRHKKKEEELSKEKDNLREMEFFFWAALGIAMILFGLLLLYLPVWMRDMWMYDVPVFESEHWIVILLLALPLAAAVVWLKKQRRKILAAQALVEGLASGEKKEEGS